MNQRFEIGEEVLCIESTIHVNRAPIVTKGRKYTVDHVEYCPSCGVQSVGVGVKKTQVCNISICCNCHCEYRFISPHILLSKKFIRVQDIDNQLEIAVENENYELAQILHESKLSN